MKEDDPKYGDNQYAVHKIFNEWQAQDYIDKYGMSITGIRPANVTGPDKVRGSVDHVQCITQPARGRAVQFSLQGLHADRHPRRRHCRGLCTCPPGGCAALQPV